MVFDLNENFVEMFPHWPIQGVITIKVSLRGRLELEIEELQLFNSLRWEQTCVVMLKYNHIHIYESPLTTKSVRLQLITHYVPTQIIFSTFHMLHNLFTLDILNSQSRKSTSDRNDINNIFPLSINLRHVSEWACTIPEHWNRPPEIQYSHH